MASILQKAKQQKAKKAPAATNLNDLNKAVAFEDKTNVPIQTAAKKQDDDWGTEQHEAIEIQQIKTEKKEEEEVQPKEAVQQQKVENVTWGATKEMDEQEGFLIAAAQAQASQGEVEDPNKGKKVMKSWVPQLREDGGNASSTFEEEKEYFPEMGVDILTKKVEKPKPTLISRAEGSSSSGTASSNPPRFSGGAKGGFKPLEMTEQQKKLLEISENNKKEYSNPPQNQNGEFGGPRGVEGYGKSEDSYGSSRAYNNNDGFGIGRNTNTTTSTPAALPGSELFGASSATQPPRFTSKKATEGGNFVAIQKSEQDIKQEEAQKRIEEMLKEKRENAAKNVEEEDKFEMRRNVEKKTESASNVESQQIARGEEPSVAKPPPRFVNANKTAATGPKFKDIEVKEEKLPGGLEEKKYLQKKEAPKEEDKQQQQQQDNNNTKQEDDGFKMVRA